MLKVNQCSINEGFTLIELMVVIAIIGILAALAVPQYNTYTKKAKFSEVVNATAPFKLAVDMCYLYQQDLTQCGTPGTNGILSNITSAVGYVGSVSTSANGVLLATAANTVPFSGTETFQLQPTAPATSNTSNSLVWLKSGTCITSALC
jgi:type IV pilus assembly protein PilA